MKTESFKGALLFALMMVSIVASVFTLLISTTGGSGTYTLTVSIDDDLVKASTPMTLTITVANAGPDAVDNVRIILEAGSNFAPLKSIPKDNIVSCDTDNIVVLPAGTIVELLQNADILLLENTDVIVENQKWIWTEALSENTRLNENAIVEVRQDTSAANIPLGDNIKVTRGVSVYLENDNRLRLLGPTLVVLVSGNIVKLPENTLVGLVATNDNGILVGENVRVTRNITVTLADNRVRMVTDRPSNLRGHVLSPGENIQLYDNQVVLRADTIVQLGRTVRVRIAENDNVIREKDKQLDVTGAAVENKPLNWTQRTGIIDPISSVPAVEWKGIGDNKIPAGGSLAFPFALTTPSSTGDYKIWVRTKENISEIILRVDGTAPTVTVTASPLWVKDNVAVTITVKASETLAKLENVMVAESNAPENTQVAMTSADSITWTGTYTTGDNWLRDGVAKVYVIGSQVEDLVGNVGSGVTENTFTIDRLPPPMPSAEYSLTSLPAVTDQTSHLVSGYAVDNILGVVENCSGLTVKIRVNAAVMTVVSGADGIFYRAITLSEGTNEVGVRFVDKAGNEGPENVQIVYLIPVGLRAVIYPAADVYAFSGNGTRYSRTQLKFDISGIPSGSNVLSAKLWLYRFAADSWDGEVLLNRVDDQLWGEKITATEFDAQILTNEETQASKFMSPGWDYLNVENQLNVDHEAGHAYSSYRLRWANDDGGEPSVGIDDGRFLVIESELDELCIFFPSSEYNGSDPYLEVVYVPPYAVSVSISPTYKSGAPGEELSYAVTVANMGNLDDNYLLTVSDDAGWGPTLGDNLLEVPAGEDRQTTLSVTIPAGAENCTRDNITVTVISQADNTVRDNASCIAHAVRVGFIPRGPIYINGDDNFIPANGVTSGSGTENDPYIIENWDISAENAHGIWIENTTAHFIVRNCYVHDGWNNGKYGIYLDPVINGIIDNNIVENNGTGIYLEYSDNNIISNNIVRKNLYNGIRLDYSNNNIIENNLAENNGDDGIELVGSNNNSILNNLTKNNVCNGIVLSGSCNNSLISSNTMENNYYGIRIFNSDNCLISSNTVENNGDYGICLDSSDNSTISGNTIGNNSSDGIYLSGSDNNLISNNVVKNGYNPSIELEYSDNNLLFNNTVENNHGDGIRLHYSDNNFLSNNTLKNNFYDGIDISGSNNIVSNNIMENNTNGIRLYGSSNLLSNNICSNNNNYGIRLEGLNNTLDNNVCSNNFLFGIRLESSSNNTLSNNIVKNNYCAGIGLWNSDNATISNNIVENNSDYGIHLFGVDNNGSDNNHIENNIVENNGTGIYLEYSDYNLISNDIVRKNLYNGIRLDYSHNNIIENNLVENNALGIQLYSSHNNPISNNLVENNIEGIRLDCSNNNLISNNLAENNSGGIILGNYSDNNLVSNNIVENNDGYGISLTYYTSNNTLSNNICSNNFGGIFLDRSENCVILNNTVENNYYGINLGHSDNNLISGNTVENNYYDDIHLLGSDNNLLSNNTVVGNNYTYGIYLDDSSINTIEKNLLENNLHGIYLWYSLVNTICNNTVENNTYGIQLSYYSDNNHIYHNNILNNATQAYDECSNFWDNGYPSGGNYWSDYTGSDNYWGENQDIPGSDGIGDTPYYIPGDTNRDRYPLMEPWMPRASGVIVRGKDTAYNVNLAGNPPLKLYTSSPPLMIAARVGSGAVVAAGTVSTCRDNMWNNPSNPIPYFDVLLDKAFQWMMPGAKEVLWYEGYGVYNTIDTPEVRCQQLEDALEAKGYTLTGDATMPITSDLLSGYDILVIPQLQLGDMGTGGDPALLPDADVQAIVDFVRGGGGLLIMDSSDYGGQNYCKVQNKILRALDASFYLQDDQVQDDTNRWGAASYQPIAVIDTATAIGSSYQAATGKDEIGLYSICSLRIEKDYDVSVEVSPFANLGEAGDNLLYEAMVTNIGRNADNYIITVTDSLAWPISVSEDEISLLPGENTVIVVRVTVPENLMEKRADWVTLRASGVSGAEDSADFRAISVVPLEKPPYPIAHPETLCFLGPGLPTLLVDAPAVPIITAIETGYSNDLTPREPWPILYGKGEFAPVGAAALVDNGRVIATANSILRDRYFDRAELANDEVMSLIARWMINWDDPRGHEFLYYCTDPALGTYHVPSIVSKWLNMVENECGFELGVQVGGEITPELLDNYDVLQLAELMRPFSPDEIQAVVNWVKGGGGLIIMCSADYGGYSRPNYLNEILEALDCPIRFQDDELYDDDSWVIDGPWFPQVYLLDPREVNPEFDVWFPPPPPPPVIEWDALITATFSGGSDDAIFGARLDASSGFDIKYDIPEPPAPPEPPYVRAYFYYPEQTPDELHRSCLPPENFMEWPLRIEYADDIEDITLTWSVENIPSEYSVLLYRGGASVADMRAEDHYTFEAASDNYDFRVIVGKLLPFTLELAQGWNMISFPILTDNMSPDAIFEGYYVLYRWDAENKRYVLHADSGDFIEPDPDVEVGVGYWVYLLEDENVDLLGFPVERLILSLRQGWNLIGSPYGGSSIADPADDPDDSVIPWAFTWNAVEKRYDMTQLLEAGKGYWVYALRNCTLTLPAPKVTTPPSTMISVSAEKSAPNTVKLTISHVGGDDLVINDLQIKATNDNVGGMVTIDNPDLGVGATFTVGESGSVEYEYIGAETGDVLTVDIIHKPSHQKIFSSSNVVVQAGYPAISMNVEVSGFYEIIIRVLSGSIEAGEWAYSVSTTEGAYTWVTGTEALIAPTVSLGTYAAGTWYVNVKHIASGHIYFTPDQVVTLPAP